MSKSNSEYAIAAPFLYATFLHLNDNIVGEIILVSKSKWTIWIKIVRNTNPFSVFVELTFFKRESYWVKY